MMLLGALGTGIAAVARGLYQKLPASAAPEPTGKAEVMGGFFMEKRIVQDNTTAVLGLHGAINVLNEHFERMEQRLHDEEIRRKAREDYDRERSLRDANRP